MSSLTFRFVLKLYQPRKMDQANYSLAEKRSAASIDTGTLLPKKSAQKKDACLHCSTRIDFTSQPMELQKHKKLTLVNSSPVKKRGKNTLNNASFEEVFHSSSSLLHPFLSRKTFPVIFIVNTKSFGYGYQEISWDGATRLVIHTTFTFF